MAREIICKVNLGTKMQQVLIKNGDDVQTFWMPFSDIAEFVAKQEVKKVHLGGPKDYVSKIEKDFNGLNVNFDKKNVSFVYF